jgi:CheY-like chemotaxis protein
LAVNRTAKILLVDDQEEMEMIVRLLVRRQGHEITARTDVPSAWKLLTAAPDRPDLVLLDINLPGESGLGLCRRIRSELASAALPVAVFSHWGRTEEIESALQAGADFVLPKDLVAQLVPWQDRLAEILNDLDSQPPALSLSSLWPALSSQKEPTTAELISTLRRALARLPLRPLRVELIRLLTGQAMTRARLDLPGSDQLAGLLVSSPSGDGSTWQPQVLMPVIVAMMEQLRYVFGTAAVEPCRAVLAQAWTRC